VAWGAPLVLHPSILPTQVVARVVAKGLYAQVWHEVQGGAEPVVAAVLRCLLDVGGADEAALLQLTLLLGWA
jgi:hypothetical protein